MLKKVTLLGAIAASALVATSAAMAAGGGNSQNARDAAACVQAGVGTLVSLNLIDEAAQGKLNYYPLGSQPGSRSHQHRVLEQPHVHPAQGRHRASPLQPGAVRMV